MVKTPPGYNILRNSGRLHWADEADEMQLPLVNGDALRHLSDDDTAEMVARLRALATELEQRAARMTERVQ